MQMHDSLRSAYALAEKRQIHVICNEHDDHDPSSSPKYRIGE